MARAHFLQPVNTLIAPTDTPEAADKAVQMAVDHLAASDLVALPTETVYGLGADAFDEVAVAKVFEVKERPKFDPLIIHLPKIGMLTEVADVPVEIEKFVRILAAQFWPGPLTMLLPKRPVVPDIVTAGLDSVAIRMSEHPVFRRVAKEFGRPIAAPSANRFGRISPTSAAAVHEELGGRIPLILDGGACGRGLESTIVRLHAPGTMGNKGEKPGVEILRAGPVTADDLKKYCKLLKKIPVVQRESEPAEAPGQLSSHYAPAKRLRVLNDPADFEPEAGKRYGLLSFKGEEKAGYLNLAEWEEVAVLSPGVGKMPEAAIRFFFLLRQLDNSGIDEIIAEPIPERGLGVAMMDRLRRASY